VARWVSDHLVGVSRCFTLASATGSTITAIFNPRTARTGPRLPRPNDLAFGVQQSSLLRYLGGCRTNSSMVSYFTPKSAIHFLMIAVKPS
jgi:hypothetical protein